MFLRAFASISAVMSTPMARPCRPNLLAGDEHVEPAARAQVQHHLARLQRGQRVRVPARQTHVRPLGQRRQLFRAIANMLGQVLRCRRRGAAARRRRPAARAAALRYLAIALAHCLPNIFCRFCRC